MLIEYEPDSTMRDARAAYFEANDFGVDGGYGSKWVTVHLGPIPFSFPNSASRVRAVRYHDLHHVLTEYDTDIAGEFEISAWEIGAGCKGFAAAWVLNLSGMVGGLVRCPRRTFRAFLRGRRSQSLYGRDYEALLEQLVRETRQQVSLPDGGEPDGGGRNGSASLADVALFALSLLGGLAVGLPLLAVTIPMLPLALVSLAAKRRTSAPGGAANRP